MPNQSKPILTVVEELKGLQIEDFNDMYNPDFWLPFIPMRDKKLDLIADKTYHFKVVDTIKLDPLGAITKDFIGVGQVANTSHEDQGTKGQLWVLNFSLEKPLSKVEVRIRARNLPGALKVGIFVQKLEFDNNLLQGFGLDGVLFAARVKIRDLTRDIHKKLLKK